MEVYHASAARVEHNEAYHAILGAKYARITEEMSRMYHITMEEAMDRFYSSDTLQLMEEGVADLHCRSDKYLAQEIWNEKK